MIDRPPLRTVATGILFALVAPWASAGLDPVVFAQLEERARHRAAQPHADTATPMPEPLLALDYDGHRDVRCPPDQFLWAGTDLPFRVQFKHRGWLFREDVALSVVDPMQARVEPLPFSADRFTYGPVARETLDPAALPDNLGYAGLSLHHVTNPGVPPEDETYNEVVSIQGGCYFRAVGLGQHWGASARAVAIDTAVGHPEEFPQWVELWAQNPTAGDDRLTLYGILDGPSVVGAYALSVRPGTEADPTLSMEVTGKLFFRESVDKLGLAPITSMFLFGEDTPARHGDYRPEVHDSDGLLMQHADGSLDWRPLRNPPRLAVSRFKMTSPRGFGLVQRDRDFTHYQDLETEMQIRPSVWVQPRNDWGEGWVELLEIATDDEGIDNIGAYWVPADADSLSAGSELELSYALDFTRDPRPTDRSNTIPWVSTRTVLSDGTESANSKSLVRTVTLDDADGRPVGRFLIDTAPGSALPNGTIVRADVTVGRGELVKQPTIQYNRFTDAYRLFFDVRAEGEKPVELRATLRDKDGDALTETWLYRWDLP